MKVPDSFSSDKLKILGNLTGLQLPILNILIFIKITNGGSLLPQIFYLHGIKADNPFLPAWVVNQNTRFTLSCQRVLPALQ